MTEDEERLDKAKFFFEVVSKTDETIVQAHERLIKKVYQILGILSAIFPLVFGLGYFILDEKPVWYIFLLFSASLVTFVIALIQGLLLLRQKRWFEYVNPLKIVTKYKDKDLAFLINKYSATWADTINHNIQIINSYRFGLRNMLFLIILGLILLIEAFILLGIILVFPNLLL